MAVEGAIAQRIRGIVPITWDAITKDVRYSDALLRTLIDTTKTSVTGTNVAPAAESAYSLLVIDFIAKVALIELIPAAIDLWMNEPTSESATGTNEMHTFVDRAEKLKELREELLKETRLKAPDIAAILGFIRTSSRNRPRSSTLNDDFLTPSPQEFQRPFRATAFS